jgi:hypothetical protein
VCRIPWIGHYPPRFSTDGWAVEGWKVPTTKYVDTLDDVVSGGGKRGEYTSPLPLEEHPSLLCVGREEEVPVDPEVVVQRNIEFSRPPVCCRLRLALVLHIIP